MIDWKERGWNVNADVVGRLDGQCRQCAREIRESRTSRERQRCNRAVLGVDSSWDGRTTGWHLSRDEREDGLMSPVGQAGRRAGLRVHARTRRDRRAKPDGWMEMEDAGWLDLA